MAICCASLRRKLRRSGGTQWLFIEPGNTNGVADIVLAGIGCEPHDSVA